MWWTASFEPWVQWEPLITRVVQLVITMTSPARTVPFTADLPTNNQESRTLKNIVVLECASILEWTERQVESRLLLNIVILECASILELLASKDKTLLIWGNTFLVLDLSLDSLNRVRALSL